MKFNRKIFSGYLLLALIFSGGVLFCLKPLGPIERSFERLSAENLPVLSLIQEIRTQGSLLHAEILEMSYLMALESTPETRLAIQSELVEKANTRKRLVKDVEDYRRLVELYFPEESSYIPLLQNEVDQLIQLSDGLNGQASGQQYPLSLARKFQFEEIEERFLVVTGEIISNELREIQMRRQQVSESVARAYTWIGVTFIVSLIAALLLDFFLARRIARPVSRLLAAVEAFTRDRGTSPVAVTRGDEIDRLTDLFDLMKERMDQQGSALEESLAQEKPFQSLTAAGQGSKETVSADG
jgi:methyl-accepting chemotaxis protein